MKNNKKIVFLLLLLLISLPITKSINSINQRNLSEKNCKEEKINLLRVEHYLDITAEKDVDKFNVYFAFPPDYRYQKPIYLQVFNDSTDDILNYKIENDTKEPNKFVNFTIKEIKKDEHKLIHFTIWVLVKNISFNDIPISKEFPVKENLSNETKKWLTKTDVVQTDNVFIKLKSKQIRFFNKDMISYAKHVSEYIKDHRYLLFVLQLNLGVFFSQDAVTTLFLNGENVGRGHLACALLRNQNIPSRIVLVNNDQGFWTQMHYMVEYYVPEYGWVLTDTTEGKTPYDTGRQIINRISYPEDENNTKEDYIYKFMKGEERWIWIDNTNVKPYYVDCRKGSKSQMFIEKKLNLCDIIIDKCLGTTSETFTQYQEFLGKNLTGQNKLFFENGAIFQKNAIYSMKNGDIFDYYYNIRRAGEEYKKIINCD